MRKEKTNPLEQAEDQTKHKKQNRTHWSRKPEQIRRDTAFLRRTGLFFQEDSFSFHRMRPAELKDRVITLLMEAKFEGADSPDHQLAHEIWHQKIEELRGA
ncbi:MAG: hypothetical protein ISR86_09950 [Nitrospinaceae bacterium]|nr:hypothetical protein [Nitrospinaceae bacterium]